VRARHQSVTVVCSALCTAKGAHSPPSSPPRVPAEECPAEQFPRYVNSATPSPHIDLIHMPQEADVGHAGGMDRP